MEAGIPFGLRPGSPNRIRRIEGGVLDYGSDILSENNPYEMGLERLVSMSKSANFMGKDALIEISYSGVSKKITGVFMSGPIFEKHNEHRWPVSLKGNRVGEVTSAVFSQKLQRNIGFALVDVDIIETNVKFDVDNPEGVRKLEFTQLPFIDKKKSIPRRRLR